jgi:thiol-disulfide isomerase/thioredoxin
MNKLLDILIPVVLGIILLFCLFNNKEEFSMLKDNNSNMNNSRKNNSNMNNSKNNNSNMNNSKNNNSNMNNSKNNNSNMNNSKNNNSNMNNSKNNNSNMNNVNSVTKPVIFGEILHASCDDYGPARLESVDNNLLNSNSTHIKENESCNSLHYSPFNIALKGPQVPKLNSQTPSLAQLKTPEIDAVNSNMRPSSFGMDPKDRNNNSNMNNSNMNNSNKKARVTMVWADWCGFSRKAKPEWDKLVDEVNSNGGKINGVDVDMKSAEHKTDPEVVKEFQTKGFPTYYVDLLDSNNNVEKRSSFNGIKKEDIHNNIKKELN